MALSDLLKITQQIDEENEKKKPAASSGSSGSSGGSGSSVSESSSSILEEEEEESSRPELTDIKPVVPIENIENLPDKNPEDNKPATLPAHKPSSGDIVPLVQKPSKKGSVQRPTQSLYQSESEMDRLRNEKWYDGDTPTEVDVVARIYKIAGADKAYAEKLFGEYMGFKEGGAFKETYGAANSSWLSELGIEDPSQLNDEIIAGFQKFIAENGVTTASGALSSSKKNGKNAYLAYQLDQLCNDYFDTKELLDEQDELFKEISYWVSQGYTNDEIKDKINLSKYNGLYSAKEKTKTGEFTPTTATVAALTSYGIDGMIYAARNNGGTGDYFADAVHNKLGRGVQPNATPEQIARRTAGDPAWAPYAVGTTMHDDAMLFGVTGFDRKWLDENYSRIAASGDPKLNQAYGRISDAVEFTENAEAEAAKLKGFIQKALDNGVDPAEIFTDDLLYATDYDDKPLYPSLQKMYEGQKKLNLVDVAHAVDFDLYAWQKDAEKFYKERKGTISGKDYEKTISEGLGSNMPAYEGQDELDKEEEENIKLYRQTMDYTNTTPAEGAALTIKTPGYVRVAASVSTGISAGNGGYDEAYLAAIGVANDYIGKNYLRAMDTLAAAEKDLAAVDAPMNSFVEKWFPGQDRDEVVRGLANGQLQRPDDPEFQQDVSLVTNQVGSFEDYANERAELEASIVNEKAIIENANAMLSAAEELNVSGKPTQSVMPTIELIAEFKDYNAEADYAEFGDWQYQVEANGVDWATVSSELGKRKESNLEKVRELELLISQAGKWGLDESYLDGLRRAKDVVELDNKLIDYAKMQDAEGFAEAVKQFDEQEESKTNWFNNSRENVLKNLMVEYTRLTGMDMPKDAAMSAEDAFLNYASVSNLNEDLALKITLMTENERDTFKYLYESEAYGPEAAEEFFSTLEGAHLESRQTAYREMVTEERTEQHPGLMNVLSIAASPIQAIGVVEVVRAALTGDDIDPDSEWFAVSQVVGKVRDVTTEGIVEHFGEGTVAAKVATFGYQVVTSMGDSLAAGATGSGLVTMGLEAFTNTALECAEKGVGTWDTILMSGVNMLAEVATEKLPFDQMTAALKNGGKEGLKGLVKTMLASSLSEAPGEALSELISVVGEDVILSEFGRYQQLVSEFYKTTKDRAKAEKMATQEIWKQIGMAALSGTFSGAGQAGISYGFGALKNAPRKKKPQPKVVEEQAAPAQQEAPVEEAPTVEQQAPAEEEAALAEEQQAPAQQPQAPFEYTKPEVATPGALEKKAPANIRMVTALSDAQMEGVGLDKKTATVQGVFEAGGLNPEIALAAAKDLAKNSPMIQKLQQAIQKADESGVLDVLKAFAYRTLVPSTNVDGMTDSDVISAVENDPAKAQELAGAVMNSEIAEETVNVLSEMDSTAIKGNFKSVRSAKQSVSEAAKRLSLLEADVENSRKALQTASAELKQNPSDGKLVNRALRIAREMKAKQMTAEQARLEAEKARSRYNDAKTTLEEESIKRANEARREAKNRVEQRMAERTAMMQQQKAAEEQQRVADEQKAAEDEVVQPEADRPSENAPVAQEEQLDADDIIAQEVEKMRAEMQEETAEFREQFKAKQKELADRRKYRSQILKTTKDIVKALQHPTKKKHVIAGLDKAVVDFLETLDLGQRSKAARDLGGRIKGLVDAFSQQNSDAEGLVDPDLLDSMRILADESKGLDTIGKLSTEQMRDLRNMVKSVQHGINNANKMFASRRNAEVSDVAGRTISWLSGKKDQTKKEGMRKAFSEMLNNGMLDGFHFFDKLGSAAKEVFTEVRDGFDKKVRHVQEAIDYAGTVANGLDEDVLGGENAPKTLFKLQDGSIELTKGQVMELFCLYDRKQARPHILHGGIRTADSAKAVKVTENGLKTIFSTLTEKEKAAAKKLQHFMANECTEWGNETSMALYGYRKFTEADYYPIHVDPNTTRTAQAPEGQNASLYSVLNMGFTKETKHGAINTLMIGDIFDTFSSYVDKVSTYNAYGAPITDMLKWYNYKAEDGTHMKSVLEQKVGDGAQNFITTLIRDLSGQSDRGYTPGVAEQLVRRVKSSSVGGNLRVVIQQPTAIARAALVMNPKYLMAGVAATPSQLKRASLLAKKYSPIANWKSLGFYETNIGPSMRKMMFGGQGGFADKAVDGSMKLAGMADQMAFAMMWRACEAEVRNTKPELQGESFYQEVGKRLSDVIDYTQVVDSPLHKTQMMRSKDGFVQMTTSFMSEPMKTYNMLYSAIQSKEADPNNKMANVKLGRALAVYASSAILNALAQSAWDAVREDDEDEFLKNVKDAFIGDFDGAETFGDYVKAAAGSNAVSGLNPLGMIPLVKDVISKLQGYDVERMDMQGIDKLIKVVNEVPKLVKGESEWNALQWIRAIAGPLSTLSGVPVDNIIRDGVAIWNTGASALGFDKISAQTKKPSFSDNCEDMYQAMMSGDSKGWEKAETAVKNGKKPKNNSEIDTQIAETMSETDTRTYEAWDALASGHSTEVELLRSEMIEDILRAGVVKDPARAKEIVDKAINAHRPTEEKTHDPDKVLTANLYESKDAADMIFGMADIGDSTATMEDLELVISELTADSTAKNPAKQVMTNIMSQVKKKYIKMYKENGLTEDLVGLHNLLIDSFDISAGTIINWQEEAEEDEEE